MCCIRHGFKQVLCLTDPTSSYEHLMDREMLWMLCIWAVSKVSDHCSHSILLESIVLAAHGFNRFLVCWEKNAWMAGPREWWWNESSWQLVLLPRAHCQGQSRFTPLRFNKTKYLLLPLGHNPQQLQAGQQWLGRAQEERAGAAGPQCLPRGAGWPMAPGLGQLWCGQQDQGSDVHPPALGTGKASPQVLCPGPVTGDAH